MIDPSHIGATFPPFSYEISRVKIDELATATGDSNPVYHDLAAAQASGFLDLPAPPTLPTLFSFWAHPPLLNRLAEIGANLARVLHTEEEYEYLAPICAGDTVTGTMRIANVRSRRGMDLVYLETTYMNQRGETAVLARSMLIVQHER